MALFHRILRRDGNGDSTRSYGSKDDVLNLCRAVESEVLAAHPGQPEPQPRAHQWDKYGERCELCGDKNWMPDSPCRGRTPEPRAEVTALIATAEQVVSADRAGALDDYNINASAAAIDVARAKDSR